MNDCGCKVEYQRDQNYAGHSVIVYCPLHKAAPIMLDALKEASRHILYGVERDKQSVLASIASAVYRAEEKTT